LALLLQYGENVGATVSRVSFARRNLLYPEEQFFPHTCFEEEVDYLKSHFPSGESHIFGPKHCDHHYMFVYQNPDVVMPEQQTNFFEVLMTGLDRDVMRQFYRDESFVSVEELVSRSKIGTLYNDNTLVDAHAFEPLGFSLNSLENGYYSTIHITPQPECSYVSFETNNFDPSFTHSLVNDVITIFKPKSFTVLVVCNSIPFTSELFPGYITRGLASHKFIGTGNTLTWCSFTSESNASVYASSRVVPDSTTCDSWFPTGTRAIPTSCGAEENLLMHLLDLEEFECETAVVENAMQVFDVG